MPIFDTIKMLALRRKQFLSNECPSQVGFASPFKLRCFLEFPELCYQTCPKCGSTSILRSFSVFGESIGSTCGFRGGKAIIIIARDIVGRCLSAYAQVTFQGYKRKEKLLKAQRNKYALLDPRNPIERLSLFIDAYKNLDRRKDILDIYHAYPMMHFYSNLLFLPEALEGATRTIYSGSDELRG